MESSREECCEYPRNTRRRNGVGTVGHINRSRPNYARADIMRSRLNVVYLLVLKLYFNNSMLAPAHAYYEAARCNGTQIKNNQ